MPWSQLSPRKRLSGTKEGIESKRAVVARDLRDAKVKGVSIDNRFKTAYSAALMLAGVSDGALAQLADPHSFNDPYFADTLSGPTRSEQMSDLYWTNFLTETEIEAGKHLRGDHAETVFKHNSKGRYDATSLTDRALVYVCFIGQGAWSVDWHAFDGIEGIDLADGGHHVTIRHTRGSVTQDYGAEAAELVASVQRRIR